MDFTINLSKEDWDARKGGWNCQALKIPGIEIVNIYVNGSTVDHKYFSVEKNLHMIRWASSTRPEQASIHLHVNQELSTQELTDKWKKIAIILPVVGSIFSALIAANYMPFWPYAKASASIENGTDAGLIKYFKRSNDFLTSEADPSFEKALSNAKREAWFIGSTFYISADTYKDLILKKLSEGVDVYFIIFDPRGKNINAVSTMLNIPEAELEDQCNSGIRTLKRIHEEAIGGKLSGSLGVKLVDEAMYSRVYFFDPKTDGGMTYYVPQVNRANSNLLPGFLVNNKVAQFHKVYFGGVSNLWKSDSAISLSEWLQINSDFR